MAENTKIPKQEDGESDEAFDKRQKQFIRDKLQILIIIDSTIAKPVMKKLRHAGYDEDQEDPKVLWDTVMRIIPSTTKKSSFAMIRKLLQMRLENFDGLPMFLNKA